MPSDINQIKGKKQYFDSIEDILVFLRHKYQPVYKEGSVGSYSFYSPSKNDENLIGEAWLHKTKPGFWLRYKG